MEELDSISPVGCGDINWRTRTKQRAAFDSATFDSHSPLTRADSSSPRSNRLADGFHQSCQELLRREPDQSLVWWSQERMA